MSEESTPRSRKRKIEALGASIASAALSDVVSRGIGAVVGKLDERRRRPGVDDDGEVEVERLDTLVTMVRAAMEAADGVHIRNWWLRRWLWKLRDAACEGAAAVSSFRRRAAEGRHGGCGAREGPWWARLLRSARSLFFFSRDGGCAGLHLQVAAEARCAARLEDLAAGMGDFLNLLDREISLPTRPPLPPPPAPEEKARTAEECGGGRLDDIEEIRDWESLSPLPAHAHPDLDDCPELSVRMEDSDPQPCRRRDGGASESGSRPKLDLERCISDVIGFAVGARFIWFAFQFGSQVITMGRRDDAARPRRSPRRSC